LSAATRSDDQAQWGMPGGALMRTILNVIWLVLCGMWMAICYLVAAVLAFVLIITIPFGVAALRIAGYVLWPFGRRIEPRRDAGVGAQIGNILWIILFGWWLALCEPRQQAWPRRPSSADRLLLAMVPVS
jgi:Inner membrane component domain